MSKSEKKGPKIPACERFSIPNSLAALSAQAFFDIGGHNHFLTQHQEGVLPKIAGCEAWTYPLVVDDVPVVIKRAKRPSQRIHFAENAVEKDKILRHHRYENYAPSVLIDHPEGPFLVQHHVDGPDANMDDLLFQLLAKRLAIEDPDGNAIEFEDEPILVDTQRIFELSTAEWLYWGTIGVLARIEKKFQQPG